MELLHESRLDITAVNGKLYPFQEKPRISQEPVLLPDTHVDGAGAAIYGTVLHDGGRYRMWYQAWPADWDGGDVSLVGYAESDDGQRWRKPNLGLVDYGGRQNNLCDMGFHCPSVFIDPEAAASHRYRAAGYVSAAQPGCRAEPGGSGYYTFHSADGLHWEPDGPDPTWDSCDVITTAYHPRQRRGIASMKFNPQVGGFMRRVIYTAELRDGQWSPARPALIPDEFDDLCAVARGYVTGDYYGMTILPAGSGTAGLIWQFRHRAPRLSRNASGQFGECDITLAYQIAAGGCWQHRRGRADFISHGEHDWTRGGLYAASTPIEVGDEHWLYVTGSPHSHAWSTTLDGETDTTRRKTMTAEGGSRIGIARWPKWRLFGFRADPAGMVVFRIGPLEGASELHLNYACEPGGRIDAGLTDDNGGEVLDRAARLTGDAVEAKMHWEKGVLAAAAPGEKFWLKLQMDRATVWGYEPRSRCR